MTLKEYIIEQLKKYLGIRSPSEDAKIEGQKIVDAWKKGLGKEEDKK